jgi:hypothetical protein
LGLVFKRLRFCGKVAPRQRFHAFARRRRHEATCDNEAVAGELGEFYG